MREFYFKNKKGLSIKVPFLKYVALFECYFLSEFIIHEHVTCLTEEVILDCSDAFLTLLGNDYLQVDPSQYNTYDNK